MVRPISCEHFASRVRNWQAYSKQIQPTKRGTKLGPLLKVHHFPSTIPSKADISQMPFDLKVWNWRRMAAPEEEKSWVFTFGWRNLLLLFDEGGQFAGRKLVFFFWVLLKQMWGWHPGVNIVAHNLLDETVTLLFTLRQDIIWTNSWQSLVRFRYNISE